ncbi:hypothetical protein TNCV_989521 [Trichonephila clavipes]|nr:hypothetical protein TNCV_989521 [Trichonephila clavipes]
MMHVTENPRAERMSHIKSVVVPIPHEGVVWNSKKCHPIISDSDALSIKHFCSSEKTNEMVKKERLTSIWGRGRSLQVPNQVNNGVIKSHNSIRGQERPYNPGGVKRVCRRPLFSQILSEYEVNTFCADSQLLRNHSLCQMKIVYHKLLNSRSMFSWVRVVFGLPARGRLPVWSALPGNA